MCEATQATQSLPEVDDGEDETPKEKVWGRLISLNPTYPNVELTGFEVVLGRQSCCNVQYNDNLNISGKHCRIFREPSVNGSVIAFIQDMSTNGTFVNGEKLGKGNRLLLSSGFEIALVLNKKKATDKVAYIFQECAEDKPQEDGGPQKKYDIREALGAGNFAVVKLAINKATGSRFAIKIIDKKKYYNQAGSRKEALMDEVKILRSLNHKNVIHIEEIFDTEKTLYLVLELVEGGDLFGDIAREGHYTEEKARLIFGQIVDAILFLHEQGIAHRDLKPENILLKTLPGKKDAFDIKLSDFGLSRTIGEGSFMKTMCGTPQYLAPEILTSGGIDGYGKEVDMWSAGAILYVLLCGYPPFDDNKPISIFDQIKNGIVEFPDAQWNNVSVAAKDLIKRLLTVDPSRRYTAKQTKDHPWMQGEDTIPAHMLIPDEPAKTAPTTPIKQPAKTAPAPNTNTGAGSVINYNKTLEENNPPDTPVHSSSSSSSSISTTTPDDSPVHPPNPPNKVSISSPQNNTDSNNNNGKSVSTPKMGGTKNRLLVSLESESNLQSQFQNASIGENKRKRDDSQNSSSDNESDKNYTPLPSPTPVSQSQSSGKSTPVVTPSPPVQKKLKKSATEELKVSKGSEDEGDEPKKKLKSSSSNQVLLPHKDNDAMPLSKHNSFNSSQGSGDEAATNIDDDEMSSDDDSKKGGKKKKDTRPMCKYGTGCYRKNPQHFKEFRHPQK